MAKRAILRSQYDSNIIMAEQELYAEGMLDASNGVSPVARTAFERAWMFEVYRAGYDDGS